MQNPGWSLGMFMHSLFSLVLIDSLGFSTEIIVASENKRSGHIFVSKLYLICFVIALVKTSIKRIKERNDSILSCS